MRRRTGKSVLGALLLGCVICLGAPSFLWGQEASAAINGIVKDSSGAVIPSSKVVLSSVATGVQRTTVTNSAGAYAFLNIFPGSYTLQVSKKGFKTTTQGQFTLYVNQTATFNFTLAVGAAVQKVTVQGAAVHLQASTAELGSVIDTQQVSDLPLNGRNFTQLLLLTPGASPANIGQNAGGWGINPIGTFSFPSMNGQRNRSNFFMLDGTNNLGAFVNEYAIPPIIDDIQEFKVVTHSGDAQYGGSPGAIVDVVTKSGTNQFHGDAYDFLRNSALDARNFFASKVSPLRQNQFGGTFGGPVILPHLYHGRHKTFFFLAYQGYRKSVPSQSLFLVPTAQQMAGDLSGLGVTLYNPYSTQPDPNYPGNYLREPFMCDGAGNPLPTNANGLQAAGTPCAKIPSSLLNQTTQTWMKTFYPAPVNTGIPGTNGINNRVHRTHQDNGSIRLDETFGSRDTAFVRWSGFSQSFTGGGGALLHLNSSQLFHAAQEAAVWTHTFGGSAVLQLSYGHNKDNEIDQSLNDNITPTLLNQLGFAPQWITYTGGLVLLPAESPGSGFLGGGPSITKNVWSDIYEGKIDFSKIHGRHIFKAGWQIASTPHVKERHDDVDSYSPIPTSNLETGAGGLSFASFLLGIPNYAYRDNSLDSVNGMYVEGFYGEDQWKATNRLTVNVGLRFDLPLYPGLPNSGNGDFDFGLGTYMLTRRFPSCSQSGPPCIPGGTLPAHVSISPNGKIIQNHYDNWAPRLGLAYRLNTKTVLRGSYARYYDNWGTIDQMLNGPQGWWPANDIASGSGLNHIYINSYSSNPINFVSAVAPPPNPYNFGCQCHSPRWRDAHSDQWNLGFQRQFGLKTVLTANYVGSSDINLSVGGHYNTALTPGPGPVAPREPWPYFNYTSYDRSIGRAHYDALQVSVDRKTSHGLTYLLSYTWSKNIDFCSGEFEQGCHPQNPYDLNNEKSVSGTDVPQIFSFSYVYDLPFGSKGRFQSGSKFVDYMIGNWQMNGILTLDSGLPYNVLAGRDIANVGSRGTRVNLTGQPFYPSNRTPNDWLNKAAFALPAAFTYGNEGRNILRSDWTRNLDFSLFREFPLPFSETTRLQFRAEAFNLFNTPRFGAPNTNYENVNFGKVLSTANEPRIVQFALKLFF